MARALERLLNDACVEELRRGTGGEVGITKVDRDGEIGAPAKHVEKATKEWFDKDKIGLLCSPGHRPTLL
jgi:hypothetical protein